MSYFLNDIDTADFKINGFDYAALASLGAVGLGTVMAAPMLRKMNKNKRKYNLKTLKGRIKALLD